MNNRESFKSTLIKTPLPEMLAAVNEYSMPGMIAVSHKGIEKKIFLDGEFITFASSNVADDRLGEFLIRIGKIKQVDYDNSVNLLKKTGKRQGQIFVDLGCLNPKELFWAVKAQVKEIILSLFLWTEGDIIFIPGGFMEKETIQTHSPITQIIVEGIKKIQNPRRFVAYLGGKDSVLTVQDSALDIMEKNDLGIECFQIFNLIDGKSTLEHLVSASNRNGTEVVRVL
ncbi:MAG: DUF4388 domain-containing protein, partial [Acidobacteria bacterium]|nr:DUF4388 domain-containing protein [Acidobacteriota bacterium]